jgi:glycerol-3-phosphate acyltransferase PlsY
LNDARAILLTGLSVALRLRHPQAGNEAGIPEPTIMLPFSDIGWDPVALAFGYLLGSIPFGIVLTRFAGLGDLRAVGSGNIGATNVLRTGNRALAAATLIGDVLKGTLAVSLAELALGRDFALVAGFGAVLGHVFPIWLGFKGGKGVATYLGVLIGLAWPTALIFAAVWLLTAAISHYSSLSGLVASLGVPIALYALGYPAESLLFVLLTILVWAKHAGNIRRLGCDTEPKIGARP